jgi:hypothetical protein
MGLEYISNPQVFLSPITAVGGIQGGLEKYPYIIGYQSWTTTTSSSVTSIDIPGAFVIADEPEAYIITIGGVVQHPTTYTVGIGRTINFNSPVSANLEINARQLATTTPSAQEFNFIKSTNASISTISAANIKTTDLIVQNSINLNGPIEIVSNEVYNKTTFNNLVSALAIQVNGETLYLPLLSAV